MHREWKVLKYKTFEGKGISRQIGAGEGGGRANSNRKLKYLQWGAKIFSETKHSYHMSKLDVYHIRNQRDNALDKELLLEHFSSQTF